MTAPFPVTRRPRAIPQGRRAGAQYAPYTLSIEPYTAAA
ncbi:hypothetical protein OK074_7526 [Actinobacteria bacterium OK074]|nr:hypothetical protein OK074_7526 [Actinobacteria bacterium OK074]